MKIAISATNPCHLFDLAKELFVRDALGTYFSGYPGWKLRPPAGFPLRAQAWRTLVTYGLLRVPAAVRPRDDALFRWQDENFDRTVAADLAAADGEIVHAMPGQARETFRRARQLGIETCLNHASGPVAQQVAVLQRERAAAGLPPAPPRFDAAYFAREREEYALADWHCAASTIVRDQLVAEGVPPDRIWVAPYGADPAVFHRPAATTPRPRRVVFAGQVTLRKGLRVLFEAFQRAADAHTTLDCYGRIAADAHADLERARHDPRIRLHGPVPRHQLAREFQSAAMLVLPSFEEGFGLVVPQALNCGLPCLVSDRVGAKDLIHPRCNGSIFPGGDADALAAEITWWLAHPDAFTDGGHDWSGPADLLLRQMRDQRAKLASPP